MRRVLLFLAVAAVLGPLVWFLVISPVRESMQERAFEYEAKQYIAKIEPQIVQRSFDAVNTDHSGVTGFRRESESERMELINRMSRMDRAKMLGNETMGDGDNWERIHSDLLRAQMRDARARAAEATGIHWNDVTDEQASQFLHKDWKKRQKLASLHYKIISDLRNKTSLEERRQQFEANKEALEAQMAELGIKKD